MIKVSFQDELMRLDGALARTGTRCKSTGKGGHRTWLSCFTRLGNSQGSKLKSISYKIRLSRESLQVRNDLVGAIGYWARADVEAPFVEARNEIARRNLIKFHRNFGLLRALQGKQCS
ncbi:TPA: hypothetical protein QEL76_000870 [Stenotrophomonas maltophilia]|nr:hypothetical protein [Stenotrophomonas maltophilia]